MKPVEVREELAQALQLDLVGPHDGLGTPDETIIQAPSRWYLTGFIVPLEADPSQRADEDANEEVDTAGEAGGIDDATAPEPAPGSVTCRPRSG